MILFVLIIVEIILFWIGLYCWTKYEEKAGIKVNKKEYFIIGIMFTVMELFLFCLWGYDGEAFCHSLIIWYLSFAAFIDYKTKNVYRIGSVVFVIAAFWLYISRLPIERYIIAEKTMSILLFIMITLLQGKFGMIGLGDVFTYIGIFLWLGSWETKAMTAEVLVLYILIANMIFIFTNIKQINWKRWKLKCEAAFLPSMAGAAVIMEILYIIN